MPNRKKQVKFPSVLPKEFLNSVGLLFKKQFKKEASGAEFLIFGDLYPNEVILCVSLAHPKSLRAASMHISADLEKETAEKPDKVTEQLKSMVDLAASWFAQCFEKGDGIEIVLEELSEMEP